MSTAFVKTLAVWSVVTLLAIVWVRLKKVRPDNVHFASPKREAILSLLIMIALFPLPFALNPLIDAVDETPLLVRLLVVSGCQLLMCTPIIAVLVIRHQRLETVGISCENLPTLLTLGVALAFVTTILFAAISVLGKSAMSTQAERLTIQRRLYVIAVFIVSAIAHEFIYRGYLQTRLTAWAGSLKGLLASSLIYSV
jgi:membrane protease YdiL (CAAX protease family)